MHRFFVDPALFERAFPATVIYLPEKISHQVRTVLHMKPGEQLVLLDNRGNELLCRVISSHRAVVKVEVMAQMPGRPGPIPRVILCQGLLKSARFEWILEKGTELGVSAFAPMLCHRSLSGLEGAGAAKRERWQRIIQEATEQCRRSCMPELLPISSLEQTLKDIPTEALIIMPWEDEHSLSLNAILRPLVETIQSAAPPPFFVLIGPEGGLTEEEVILAQQHNAKIVTLGHNILRAETAAIATVANIMYEFEGILEE